MYRFVKVRGKPGVLVPNPHAAGANPPRFAGQRQKAVSPEIPPTPAGKVPWHPPLGDFYEPVEEILELTPELQKAIDRQDLPVIARCSALNHAAAEKAMAAEQPVTRRHTAAQNGGE